jgi:hypothetical protein
LNDDWKWGEEPADDGDDDLRSGETPEQWVERHEREAAARDAASRDREKKHQEDMEKIERELKRLDATNEFKPRANTLDAKIASLREQQAQPLAPLEKQRLGKLEAEAISERAFLQYSINEAEAALPFADLSDDALATAIEDGEVAMEELQERMAKLPGGSVRLARAEREHLEAVARRTDLEREIKRRGTKEAARQLSQDRLRKEAVRAVEKEWHDRVEAWKAEGREPHEIIWIQGEAKKKLSDEAAIQKKMAELAPGAERQFRVNVGERLLKAGMGFPGLRPEGEKAKT